MTSVREEAAGDRDAIRTLTTAAFADQPHSDGAEAAIVDALRADGDLILSLVAVAADGIVGHAAFSPVTVEGLRSDGWVALGPLSVAPASQRRGVGSRLVRDGLARLRATGARGCVLVGDPGYYARFGFRGDVGLRYDDVPAAFVQGLAFAGPLPRGRLTYARGFEAR